METETMAIGYGEWRAGFAVTHNGREAHVAALPLSKAKTMIRNPSGEVPIIYDDESAAFHVVEATTLRRRMGTNETSQ